MPRKAILDLEWFTVSYRSIYAVALVILVIVGLAGYQHFFSKPGISVEAMLKSLDFKLEDLGGRVRRNKNLSALHEDAVEITKTAWEALARNDFSAAEARADDASQIVEAIEEELRHIQSRYTARIVSMEGEVKVKPAGDFRWLGAKRGMELKEGDKVSAGVRGSAEIIFRNGDKQLVSPGGLIEIYESRVDPETSAERLSIRISGAVTEVATTEKRKEGSYTRLLTEHALVEIGQDEARLRVHPKEEETEVRSLEGTARVQQTSTGVERQVGPRTAAVVRDRGNIATRDLPSAPALLRPPHGQPLIFSDLEQSSVTLVWEIDPRVHRYRLMVSHSKNFTAALVDNKDLRPDRKGVQLKKLVKGTYYWRVSAIDRTGFESSFSETRSFRILTEEQGTSDEAPKLEIEPNPVQMGPFVILKGRTDSGAYLTINERRFDVLDDGSFEAIVKLDRLGKNELKVIVQSATGGRTERTAVVFLEQ
ncbi:MAG: fibronectin type III domain-containing protein [Acidobacteriota bacterium]|nr:MAG: fibronectin type III domain-containing protein [Acidobacteriota bacterium]